MRVVASAAPASAPAHARPPAPGAAALRTRPACRLAISVYPSFAYDASGGGGVATATKDGATGRTALTFAPDAVAIPRLDWRTTRFLGVPLLPGLAIDVVPLSLTGWMDDGSGDVELDFRADFFFTGLFGLYAPPAIKVTTRLSTDGAKGTMLTGTGRKRGAGGGARLAGVARVDATGDALLDWFLRAPSECVAELEAELVLG